MTDNAGWVHVDFYGRAPNHQTITGVNVPEAAATLMKAFGFTHIDKLTATRVAHPENAISSSNLVSTWKAYLEIPDGMHPAGLAAWCEKEGIDPATAVIIARVEYAENGPEAFVQYEVPEGTPGARWAGLRPA